MLFHANHPDVTYIIDTNMRSVIAIDRFLGVVISQDRLNNMYIDSSTSHISTSHTGSIQATVHYSVYRVR